MRKLLVSLILMSTIIYMPCAEAAEDGKFLFFLPISPSLSFSSIDAFASRWLFGERTPSFGTWAPWITATAFSQAAIQVVFNSILSTGAYAWQGTTSVGSSLYSRLFLYKFFRKQANENLANNNKESNDASAMKWFSRLSEETASFKKIITASSSEQSSLQAPTNHYLLYGCPGNLKSSLFNELIRNSSLNPTSPYLVHKFDVAEHKAIFGANPELIHVSLQLIFEGLEKKAIRSKKKVILLIDEFGKLLAHRGFEDAFLDVLDANNYKNVGVVAATNKLPSLAIRDRLHPILVPNPTLELGVEIFTHELKQKGITVSKNLKIAENLEPLLNKAKIDIPLDEASKELLGEDELIFGVRGWVKLAKSVHAVMYANKLSGQLNSNILQSCFLLQAKNAQRNTREFIDKFNPEVRNLTLIQEVVPPKNAARPVHTASVNSKLRNKGGLRIRRAHNMLHRRYKYTPQQQLPYNKHFPVAVVPAIT